MGTSVLHILYHASLLAWCLWRGLYWLRAKAWMPDPKPCAILGQTFLGLAALNLLIWVTLG